MENLSSYSTSPGLTTSLQIHKYLENYQLAFDGFSKAFELDRNLDAAKKEMHAIEQIIAKIRQLTSKKVHFIVINAPINDSTDS